MLKWIQGGISSVTGMAEPEYGKECIHTATERVQNKQPYHEATKKDFEWLNPSSTNVETATFYFSKEDEGIAGFAQVINSNIGGIHSTGQFTFRLYHAYKKELCTWTSTKLENFRTDKCNYYADNLSLEMNEDGTEYHLKSSVNEDSIVDITVQRLTPGVKVGDDPVTYYGDNPKEPWGMMRHVFWPRNTISGTIKVKREHTVSFENDRSMMVMALQGMKPHHAAKSWNFLNFQSATHSAVLMEFTTPRSYGNTRVSIGIVCDKDSILAVTIDNTVTHVDPAQDSVGWPVPSAMSVDFDGISSKVTDDEASSADKFTAHAEGHLSQLVERVDVMAEIPNFVKSIVSGVAGTKPYIYQYVSEISLKVGEATVKGLGWCEITFISEFEDSSA